MTNFFIFFENSSSFPPFLLPAFSSPLLPSSTQVLLFASSGGPRAPRAGPQRLGGAQVERHLARPLGQQPGRLAPRRLIVSRPPVGR